MFRRMKLNKKIKLKQIKVSTKSELRKIIAEILGNSGRWMKIDQLSSRLEKRIENFDVRDFGCKELPELLEDMYEFGLKNKELKSGSCIYVRKKSKVLMEEELQETILRAEIVERILEVGIGRSNEVKTIIEQAQSYNEARERIQQVFHLSELHANNILNMRVRSFSKYEQKRMEKEREFFVQRRVEYEEILQNGIFEDILVEEG